MIDAAIYTVLGREQIADISSAVGFTAAQIPPTKPNVIYAQVQVQTSDCRWRVDGEDPTDEQGMYLATNGVIEVWGAKALQDFRAIDDTATSVLEVIYYGSVT